MANLRFDLDADLLGLDPDSARTVLISDGAPREIFEVLRNNRQFPNRKIEIGSLAISAQGGSGDIAFGDSGSGKVTFSAKAEAGIVVTPDPDDLLERLRVEDPVVGAVELPEDQQGEETNWAALFWGYDLQGGAQGKLALGAGVGATFGGDAKKEGAYAVVHRFQRRGHRSREVLKDVLNAWRLPKTVERPDDLPAGTWLFTEVDGSLALKLGVQAGYDFNWIREVSGGGLEGDIGLKVQLGLSAAVGFEASGRYVLVLSRDSLDESDQRLRVRLFKQRKKGWNFAFNAGATIQADISDFAPEDLDGLLRAILGIQEGQLLDDLLSLTSDPDKTLREFLADESMVWAKDLFEEITGLDAEEGLEEIRSRLQNLSDQWMSLDQRVAAALWDAIGDNARMGQIRDFSQKIVDTLGDDDQLRQLLESKIPETGFLASDAGQWLSGLATGGILGLVERVERRAELVSVAQRTLDILDQGSLEELISNLKAKIEEVFQIDTVINAIEKALEASDPEELDAWLKERLEKFLGKQPGVRELEAVRHTMAIFRVKADIIYKKTLEALQRQYTFSLAATFTKSTSRQALIDLEVDFAAGSSGVLSQTLIDVLHGMFDEVLVDTPPGATLHTGTLIYGVDRETHVDITLPWDFKNSAHISKALASVTATEDDGRVLLYEGTATDEVSVVKAKSRRDSQLSIVTRLPVRSRELRIHDDSSLGYSYSFRQAVTNTRKAHLGQQLQPYVNTYLADCFPTDGDGTSSGSFSSWLDDIDKQADAIENNGTGNIGNLLVNLQVGVSGEVGDAWLEAPPEGHEVYFELSEQLQRRFREIVPVVYFDDLSKLGGRPAQVLLAWSSLPPATGFRVDSRGQLIKFDNPDLFWDFQNPRLLSKVVRSDLATQRLESSVNSIHRLLETVPGQGALLKFFERTSQAARDIQSATFNDGAPIPTLISLLDSERQLVQTAAKAGYEFAKFEQSAAEAPEKAVKHLAEFSAKLGKAFNKKVWSIYGKGAIRPMGTLLFVEAARVFKPSLDARLSAMLQLAVFKGEVSFPPDRLEQPSTDQLLAQETVISL